LHLGGRRGAVFFDTRQPNRERALVYRCFRSSWSAPKARSHVKNNNENANVNEVVDDADDDGLRAYLLTEHAPGGGVEGGGGGGDEGRKKKQKRHQDPSKGGDKDLPKPHTVYLITKSVFAPFRVWTREGNKATGAKTSSRNNYARDNSGDGAGGGGGDENEDAEEAHLRKVMDHAHPTSLVPDQKLLPFIDPYSAYAKGGNKNAWSGWYPPPSPSRKAPAAARERARPSPVPSRGDGDGDSVGPPPPSSSLPGEREYFRECDRDPTLSLERVFMRIRGNSC
jgi:hypothetical protein